MRAAVQRALALVSNGFRIGVGSGRASSAFIRALGRRVQQGFCVEAVVASNASESLAREVGVPLIDLGEDVELDIVVDGADEVAPNLDLIKGWGGSLVRERIVASAAKRMVILVGPEKLVQTLGERGCIPVEIVPLARGCAARRLKALGLVPILRLNKDGSPFITNNHNLILDCALTSPLKDAAAARHMEAQILDVTGVVETGMFLGWATEVFVGHPNGQVDALTRKAGSLKT
ncbi:MAG: ribose 5-phosphate isomerase A [Planctomycetota bacterium]|nr:ribose 5-phosphate isomerase A [Planctomycetota bacterium]